MKITSTTISAAARINAKTAHHRIPLAAILPLPVSIRFTTSLAPTAEQKIEELARARIRETSEPIERARVHIIHERPDLYEDYLDDRAAAAKGTVFESSMTRGKRLRK
jgi:hypothetical protein